MPFSFTPPQWQSTAETCQSCWFLAPGSDILLNGFYHLYPKLSLSGSHVQQSDILGNDFLYDDGISLYSRLRLCSCLVCYVRRNTTVSSTERASVIKQRGTVCPAQAESWWIRVISPVPALELNRQLSTDAQMALSPSLVYTNQNHSVPGCLSGKSVCASEDKRKILVKQCEERNPCILLCSH